MGDESTPTASTGGAKQQTTQDLLADIFGTDNDMSTPVPSTAQSSVNDIMGLFGATNISTPSPSVQSSNSTADLFSSISSTPSISTPTPQAAPTSSAPIAHEAYNSNGFKITLTPIRDVRDPLVVNILAKFTSNVLIEGVNFQAAVPKVSFDRRAP